MEVVDNEEENNLHRPELSFDFEMDGIVGVDVAAARQELRKKLLEKLNEKRRKRNAAELDDNFQSTGPKHVRTKVKSKKNTKNKKAKTERIKSSSHETDAEEMEHQLAPEVSSVVTEPVVKEKSRFKAPVSNNFQFSNIKVKEAEIPSYLEKGKKISRMQKLKQAESELTTLKELEGTQEGQRLKQEKTWENAFKKAQGEKVKDRIDLIKKSIKRDQKKKEKSATEWKARIDTQAKQRLEKQQKRQENIKKRADEKKQRKMAKRKKK